MWLNFNYSRDDAYVISKNISGYMQHMYLHWHQLIENSSRWFVTMWESLLMFIENDCLLMFIVIVKSYNLRNEDQWNNYLQIIWDYVLFHSPICKHERNGTKKRNSEIQKVDFVR